MDIAVWIAQVLLALAFLVAGFQHAFGFDRMLTNPRMAWAADVGRPGMAAAALALLMVAAATFHARRREFAGMAPNAVLGAIALFVAWGRFVAAPL